MTGGFNYVLGVSVRGYMPGGGGVVLSPYVSPRDRTPRIAYVLHNAIIHVVL